MKTSLDIPDQVLNDLLRLSQKTTKKDAILTAITEYNQRRRVQKLTRHIGTLDKFMTKKDLRKLRED